MSWLARLVTLAPVLALCSSVAADKPHPWVLIDTARRVAEVHHAADIVLTLPNLSIGRAGASDLHLRGDDTTPLGEYRVVRINADSRYHVFIGLNYPTLSHLDEANQRGLIDESQYADLVRRGYARGWLPPDSVLGGYIGLHGLGNADPDIHRRFNWTQGCVALTDEQIDTLLDYVRVGTRVIIR